jgi:DNA gyrase/topoisomerase IV subunit A
MEMKHTCHPICLEEAQEIREEESELIDQLEALVVEFNEKYDELGVGMSEFYEGYWKTRMSEVLAPAERDEEVLRRAREVGVFLSEKPEERSVSRSEHDA